MRRHQTLQAAIDWSHALLSDTDQVVFRRLAVFVNGFPLELAQAVASDEQLDEWAVLEATSALVDKSLVIADVTEPPRYRLLETTRAYALEKLAAAGETDAWIERHAQAVCAYFERTEEDRRGARATLSNMDLVRRLAPELDNARAALGWAGGRGGDLNLAVGLAATLAPVQLSVGLAAEALECLSALQHRLDASVDPARAALLWSGLLAVGLSARRPMAQTMEAVARAKAFYRTAGMPRRLAGVLTLEAQFRALAGDARSAQDLLDEVCRLEDAARPELPGWPTWRVGERLAAQGWIHLAQGQLEQALAVHREQRALLLTAPGERRGLIFAENNLCRALYLLDRHDECIALAEDVMRREGGPAAGTTGPTGLLLVLAQLASGRVTEAGQTLSQALPGWRRNGTVRVASAAIAVLLAEQGHWADAARVGGAALAHQRGASVERFASARRTRQRLQALLDAAPCSRADIERWQSEGEALDEAAIEAICRHAAQAAPSLQRQAPLGHAP